MALDVLVVDDEADIRDLVAGVLEDEGYSVRTASDSESCGSRSCEDDGGGYGHGRGPGIAIICQGTDVDGTLAAGSSPGSER